MNKHKVTRKEVLAFLERSDAFYDWLEEVEEKLILKTPEKLAGVSKNHCSPYRLFFRKMHETAFPYWIMLREIYNNLVPECIPKVVATSR